MSNGRPKSWAAIDPSVDRLQQARHVRRVHDAFHAGENVCRDVRRVVGLSWGRSGDAGLWPDQLPPLAIDEREVDDRRRRHPLLAVRPVLRELLASATASAEHLLVITDASGVILWIEGHRRLLAAIEDRRGVCGADWSEREAGTNALGTAIVVDHPVQIFSAEHFSRAHHRWQGSSAPIHDPDSGALLGVVGLTGRLRTAHPHTLSLVSAAARMAEMALREQSRARDERLRDAYFARVAGKRQATALVGRGGRVLYDVPRHWAPTTLDVPRGGGEVLLADGSLVTAEPLAGGHGGFVLWGPPPTAAGEPRPDAPGLELQLLGRRPSARLYGEPRPLSLRHAELLTLLLLDGQGLTADELALRLYGTPGKAVTVRAELSRLRRTLGGVLRARPYRLIGNIHADVLAVRDAVATAPPASLLDRYPGALLPESVVPRIVAVRAELDAAVRDRVLRGDDPDALRRWCALPGHEDDGLAADRLLDLLAPGGPRRHAVAVGAA